MIFYFLSLLQDWGVRVPHLFEYSSTRMLMGALTTFALTLFLGPGFIRRLYRLKIGQPIRKEECPPLAELHKKKEHTPTMGGVLILSSLFLSMVFWMRWDHPFTWILGLSLLVLGMVGALDDYLKLKARNAKGLPGRWKLLVQVIVGLGVAIYLYFPEVSGLFYEPAIYFGGAEIAVQEYASFIFFPFVKEPIVVLGGIGSLLGIFFVVWVIVGSSNATNLTDGLDGLATGCILMVAACFSVVAFISNHIEISHYLNIVYIEGSAEIAVCLASLVGACLGFLWYNGHPAQVFMGDTGSIAMGGLLGVTAVLLRREFLLAIVGGVFVLEALSVILQVLSYRYRNKRRLFLCAPLHHHFEYRGWPETRVVTRFWIIGFLLACIGLLSLKVQ